MNKPLPGYVKRKLDPEEIRGRLVTPAALIDRLQPTIKEDRNGDRTRERQAIAPHILKLAQTYGVVDNGMTPGAAKKLALQAYYWNATPLFYLDQQGWMDLFAKVGLLKNVGLRVGDPRPAITLYRGSSIRFPHGLSWTPYFDMAAHFAIGSRLPGIFEMTVQPSHFIDSKEVDGYPHEVIVDSRNHDVRLAADLSKPRTN